VIETYVCNNQYDREPNTENSDSDLMVQGRPRSSISAPDEVK
jgi:hypothetical protein